MGYFVALTLLLKMLLLFLKLVSEVFKVGTVDKNKYESNCERDVSRKIHGKVIRKLLRTRERILSLNKIPLDL